MTSVDTAHPLGAPFMDLEAQEDGFFHVEIFCFFYEEAIKGKTFIFIKNA